MKNLNLIKEKFKIQYPGISVGFSTKENETYLEVRFQNEEEKLTANLPSHFENLPINQIIVGKIVAL